MVIEKPSVINDYIFKKIFSRKGNESILRDFLIGVLEIPIEKVETKAEVTLEKQLVENKLGRLDILATLDDETTVNIEVQILNKHNFIDRSVYYWAGLYYNELKSGSNYDKAKRTIAVNILDYELFEEGPYHEIATLRRNYKNTKLTDKMEFHFIQISKFIKEKNVKRTKLEQWMNFISQKNEEVVRLAIEENEEIKRANDEYEYLTGEEAERRIAFLIEKARKDEITMIEGSREEGRKEGKEEKQKEIVKNMLNKGMDMKLISELTNLSIEEIENIKNKAD